MKKVLLGEMSWVEAEDMFRRAKVVIVATGSTEQHGPHLPLQHDLLSAIYVAKEAAERVYPDAIVCVPTTVGTSPFHMDFPGSLTLSYDTFVIFLLDICRSVRRHGIKNVIFLNGHGDNGPPLHILTRRAKEEVGINAMWIYYWDLVPRDLCDKLFGKGTNCPAHAGYFETSTALFTHPELVDVKAFERFKEKPGPRIKEAKKFASHFKLSKVGEGQGITNASMTIAELFPSGVTSGGGSPLNATAEKGREVMEATVQGLVALVKDMF